MLGNKRKCRRDVFDDLVADKLVEIDPNPSGLQPFPALVDYLLQEMRLGLVNPQQSMPVWTSTGAATASLDAEEVVK